MEFKDYWTSERKRGIKVYSTLGPKALEIICESVWNDARNCLIKEGRDEMGTLVKLDLNSLPIKRNKRTEAGDFSMDDPCDFCDNFQSYVIELPDENKICISCLNKLMMRINKQTMDDIVSEGN